MSNVPDEGVAFMRTDYVVNLLVDLFNKKAKEKFGFLPPNIKEVVDECVGDMCASGLFVVKACDDAHINYLLKTLEEYRPTDVRYVLTMRIKNALEQVEDVKTVPYNPSEPEMPRRS